MLPVLEKLPEVERLPLPDMVEALEPPATDNSALLFNVPEVTVRVF